MNIINNYFPNLERTVLISQQAIKLTITSIPGTCFKCQINKEIRLIACRNDRSKEYCQSCSLNTLCRLEQSNYQFTDKEQVIKELRKELNSKQENEYNFCGDNCLVKYWIKYQDQVGWLIALAVITGLAILGIQAFFLWKNSQTNQERLEIEHGAEVEERKKKQEEKDERERRLQEAELDRLSGLATVGSGNLVYPEVIKKHFIAILDDIDDLINTGQVYTHKDEEQDNYSSRFTRRNTILYGMAGTGKSEFPRQLVFEIAAKYQSESEKKLNEYNEDLAKKQERLINDPESEQLKTEIEELKNLIQDCEQQLTTEESKLVPVFQIDGFHLQTAGKAINDKGLESHEKLIAILKELKKEAFGDAYSDKPYIVFVEEADQGVNVMTAGGGGKKNNLLEDWKNFLSTTEDAAGLKNNVQDPNSVIIIATNNYENLDPALEFAPHVNKIIQSWQNLAENKRKKKEAELGTFKDENDKEICN
ncbi:43642_t:CDS:2 [Gigaspora margarita]|uniref:43642_t:CDS:1 n=1 Tax=Gigaspora margarita TaxID=4874 RepID=A0ABN7UYJ0_GIGMA|nr:43642_t:CDS:2 [Gigaspora margarita]